MHNASQDREGARKPIAQAFLLAARSFCALTAIVFAVFFTGPFGSFIIATATTVALYRKHPALFALSAWLLVPLILLTWLATALAAHFQDWSPGYANAMLVTVLLGFVAGVAAWSYRRELVALAERLANGR